MNGAQLHLLLNHLPVLGLVFGVFVGLYGWLARKPDVVNVALATFVFVAVAAAAAMASGEEAEHVVEGIAGVTEAVIEPHEEAAEGAALAAYGLGVIALGLLVVYRRREVPRGAAGIALLAALLLGGWMGYVAHLGGQIRHDEIRTTAGAAQAVEREHDD